MFVTALQSPNDMALLLATAFLLFGESEMLYASQVDLFLVGMVALFEGFEAWPKPMLIG